MGFPIITKFTRIYHLRKISNSNLILGSDKGKENNKTAADLEKQAICILKKKHPHSSFLLPKIATHTTSTSHLPHGFAYL
jgi:hypothetical protein